MVYVLPSCYAFSMATAHSRYFRAMGLIHPIAQSVARGFCRQVASATPGLAFVDLGARVESHSVARPNSNELSNVHSSLITRHLNKILDSFLNDQVRVNWRRLSIGTRTLGRGFALVPLLVRSGLRKSSRPTEELTRALPSVNSVISTRNQSAHIASSQSANADRWTCGQEAG
jgi:hypothetical protein